MTDTSLTKNKLEQSINIYRRRFLNKKYKGISEQSTRILINHLLVDILGYKELDEIKIEHPVTGGYIDYLIKLSSKKQIIIEAKPLGTILTNKHLRQAAYYAFVTRSDFIIITDGRFIKLYNVKFRRPIIINQIFIIDLKANNINKLIWMISFLTRKSLANNLIYDLEKIYKDLGF